MPLEWANLRDGAANDLMPGQTIDVAYDLFAHTQSNAGTNDNPSDEIMIWLYKNGGAAAIGNATATVSIGRASWQLYESNNNRWPVHSYVRASSSDTGATSRVGFWYPKRACAKAR
ncbi:MAG TPA: hypothetical protein VF524_13005 [Polyangia bacterium]